MSETKTETKTEETKGFFVIPCIGTNPINGQTEIYLIITEKKNIKEKSITEIKIGWNKTDLFSIMDKDGKKLKGDTVKSYPKGKMPTSDTAYEAITKYLTERNKERKKAGMEDITYIPYELESYLISIISTYVPPKEEKKRDERISDKAIFDLAGNIALKFHTVVLRANSLQQEEVLSYKDGWYQECGEADIRKEVGDELKELNDHSLFSKIIHHIKSSFSIPQYREEFKPRPFCVNLLNGVLDYSTGVAVFHERKNPSDFATYNFRYIIPVKYDPDAKCPKIQNTIYQILVDKSMEIEKIDFDYYRNLDLSDPEDRIEYCGLANKMKEYLEAVKSKDKENKISLFVSSSN